MQMAEHATTAIIKIYRSKITKMFYAIQITCTRIKTPDLIDLFFVMKGIYKNKMAAESCLELSSKTKNKYHDDIIDMFDINRKMN